MFHKFLKYISQSISGMIGVSIYILADTFFISLQMRRRWTCCPESDPSGIRTDLRNRFDDRDRSATRYSISTAKGAPSD